MKEITSVDEFREAIKETCLIDFYMDNCQNCKIMSPIIDSLLVDVPVYKFKVDAYIATEISDVCRIMSAPTILMFKDGVECYRKTGLINAAELEDVVVVYK